MLDLAFPSAPVRPLTRSRVCRQPAPEAAPREVVIVEPDRLLACFGVSDPMLAGSHFNDRRGSRSPSWSASPIGRDRNHPLRFGQRGVDECTRGSHFRGRFRLFMCHTLPQVL